MCRRSQKKMGVRGGMRVGGGVVVGGAFGRAKGLEGGVAVHRQIPVLRHRVVFFRGSPNVA
jgi:hypothetical protein